MKTAAFHENHHFSVKTAGFHVKSGGFHEKWQFLLKSSGFHGILIHSLPPAHHETEGFVLN